MQQQCTFYRAGQCRAGSKCKFSHEGKAATLNTAVDVALPCKFFKENMCKAGANCRFSHEVGLKMPTAVDVVCKYYAEGYCSEGNHCPFVHDRQRAMEEKKKAQEAKRLAERQKIEDKKKKSLQHFRDTTGDTLSLLSISDSKPVQSTVVKVEKEEEEAFFYGAAGDFQIPEQKVSYTKIATLNVPDKILQQSMKPAATPVELCAFFQQGNCRYGQSCRFQHSQKTDETEAQRIREEIEASQQLECGICFEIVLSKPGERFGLLSGCTHAFCLSCVRSWRNMNEQAKDNLRQCPLCRVETYFVVPLNRMVIDPERKKAFCEAYLANLRAIPCRHFDQGRGTCPFGSSCFYEHKYASGELADQSIRTATDADGHYDVLGSIQLSHYIRKT